MLFEELFAWEKKIAVLIE